MRPGLFVALHFFLFFGIVSDAKPAGKIPILLDCDIGDDIDDAFALALALRSPELDVRGVTTVLGDTFTRAVLACRFLHAVSRDDIPVSPGRGALAAPVWEGQLQYGLRPAFRKRPEKELAVAFLYRQLKEHPGEYTLVTIGPLTNVAELLAKHPDCKPWIKRIVMMGGSVRIGYDGKKTPAAEWNIVQDRKSAKAVFEAGVPLVVAPLDATGHVVLDAKRRQRIFGADLALSRELHALYQLWGAANPVLYDPVAATLAFTEKFCTMEEMRLVVDDKGFTKAVEGKPNARVATAIKTDEFLDWYVERLVGSAKEVEPNRVKRINVAKPVERGNFPPQVHVVEDYETDIEKRWWLAGRLEAKNVPVGSKRACRGVWTNDFDDLMGDPKSQYMAVVFNPVPGPPMGKNTRLTFRCWLAGTDALKVQIYSLSKGYHRHLVLTDLPQKSWQTITVDMTQARRPDGSGGPLSEDERIDDIQFYADAGAELIVDDIVLYEAAGAEEKRAFPKRILFTGWFDTGKQGKEWPGVFEIVAKEKPEKWKAAASVDGTIRIGLRGKRIAGEKTLVRFRYYLTGGDTIEVALTNATEEFVLRAERAARQDEWVERVLDCSALVKSGVAIEEIRFVARGGGRMLVDDVMVYEP